MVRYQDSNEGFCLSCLKWGGSKTYHNRNEFVHIVPKKSYVIEIEVHFVTECEGFEKERELMYAEFGPQVDSKKLQRQQLLGDVLKNEVIKISAEHLKHMFDVRKGYVYE